VSTPRPWREKFRDAFRGIWLAIRSERSFAVHLLMTVAVVVLAIALRVSLIEACILGLCVVLVLAAEMFNTALERLARAINRKENADLAVALDIASGAVLTASIGAAIIGGAIVLSRLGLLLGWWT
jgi:diacylglycerol kinase